MLDLEQVRLIVNLDDLRDYDRTYADGSVDIGVSVRPELMIDCCFSLPHTCQLSTLRCCSLYKRCMIQ